METSELEWCERCASYVAQEYRDEQLCPYLDCPGTDRGIDTATPANDRKITK